MRKFFFVLSVFTAVFCTLSAGTLSAADSAIAAAKTTASTSYRLRPLDVIQVKVFQEPDLDTIYKIGNNGCIVLPLIGTVSVAGLSLQDAQRKVKELYEKDYLVKAEVSMFIMEYSPQRVYVIGQVNRPGEVIFPPEETMTISKAITSAAGFTRLANKSSVSVKRKMPDGSIKVFDVDVNAIFRDKNAKDFPVYEGDTIEVAESIF